MIDPNDADKWITVTCPKEIEYYLILRNCRHFGQAETDGTPFTSKKYKEKFDWMATSKQAEMVLTEEFEDDDPGAPYPTQ